MKERTRKKNALYALKHPCTSASDETANWTYASASVTEKIREKEIGRKKDRKRIKDTTRLFLKVPKMHFHSSLLSILLIVISCPLTVRTRRVAPLIEEDWARRPHRAAGKSPFQSFNFNSFFLHIAYIFVQSWKQKNSKFLVNIGYYYIGMFPLLYRMFLLVVVILYTCNFFPLKVRKCSKIPNLVVILKQ